METNEQVGMTAGKVWHTLNESGPLTVTQIKKKLDGASTSEIVGFALGWLAREDKIQISLEKKNFKVALK